MFRARLLHALLFALALLLSLPAQAVEPKIEFFSPTGTVKAVRQVAVRFSVPMVPFGDLRLAEPFEIQCPEPGKARWADSRNWIYDFARDLPGGVTCTFRLKSDAKSMNGEVLTGSTEFSFNTGGPSIMQRLNRVMPFEGNYIDEEQVFVLGLDAPADPASIVEHAWCDIQGVQEKVGVRLLNQEERKRLFESKRDLFDPMIRALVVRLRDGAVVGALDTRDTLKGTELEAMITHPENSPIAVLTCQRRLPNKALVRLVWGAGIRTPSGIATTTDQVLAWSVRDDFRAEFTCDRTNADAHCIPFLPMSLSFSAPVSREVASQIELRPAQGKSIHPVVGEDPFVNDVTFPGPFPEKSSFTIVLPPNFHDDASRPLANGAMFPLAVATDEYPPLAKFPARFGIIEANADATLPVTVRNVEAQLNLQRLKIGTSDPGVASKLKNAWNSLLGDDNAIGAKMLRVENGEVEVIKWMRLIHANSNHEGKESLFSGQSPESFTISRSNGDKTFEVIGIPLKKPGFYVVELASPRLGAALLRNPSAEEEEEVGPYYVQTAALVTNLSVHFKYGREASLVWVTSLDKGQPVAGANVEVRDCDGTIYWRGETDNNGVVRITKPLPPQETLPNCREYNGNNYFVTARLGEDFSFLFSDWNEGITPWRFQLPTGSYDGPYVASTVFDRTLLRAGETVHMKHFYRKQSVSGFSLLDKSLLPDKLIIEHLGSEQNYEQPLMWDDQNVAESQWAIPADAKLGTYRVTYSFRDNTTQNGKLPSRSGGTFQVQAFRVPTMKAIIKPMNVYLVNATSATVDAQLNYLSGGGVSGASVKFRGLVTPYQVSFSDYDGFVFANGNVREGLDREARQNWYLGEYEVDDAEEGDVESDSQPTSSGGHVLATRSVVLDGAGAARVTLDKLPKSETPQWVQAEMEYADANGEILTTSTRIPLWPSQVVIGLKPDAWAASKDKVRIHALALDLDGKPRAGVAIKLDLLQRTHFSHRKRLIGGFYAYENHSEIKAVKEVCEGTSDAKGLLICEFSSPVSGNVIVRAKSVDAAGNVAYANQDIWIAGSDDWWFDVSNDDRMDLLPEKSRYQPNETAVIQVRMPFREATALVTVEREGVIEYFVTHLSGKAPVVRVPLKGHFAPNVFVSVLAVRGRVAGVQPTALVDLGKPAFKLGITQLKVGWAGHELKVNVTPDRTVYNVRNQSAVKVQVRYPDGTPARGGEVAFAAVDEGLLELMPNRSWDLLNAMMVERGLEVTTSTAQMQVVGRRHYGRKALATGGGGGVQSSRELFDTLLLWQGRVRLDDKGEVSIRVPINDSLTSFRLVAVANAGAGLFGTGKASIRTTQDLMLFSGLPSQVREQDNYIAGVTVRNTSAKPLDVTVTGSWHATEFEKGARIPTTPLTAIKVNLAPGEAKPVAWQVSAPINGRRLEWLFLAQSATARDQLKAMQTVIPAVRVRTFQATLMQLDQPLSLPVAMPADAIPGRGGVQLHLRARLADELSGVKEYMDDYPFSCLEQQASQAVALLSEARWRAMVNRLPAYLDRDGLAKYFPNMAWGSETLTAYLITLADEAGWPIPEDVRNRMVEGLKGFVKGRAVRYSSLATADLTLRKLSAINAIVRVEHELDPSLIGSITIDPNLWPTSAVLDWIDILKRAPKLNDSEKLREEAKQIIRSRLNFQGTTMGFSTERADALWWLMCSSDVNANRVVLSLLDSKEWAEDLPRMVRGSVSRQQHGHWNTTVANAWGTLALARFSQRFEREGVTGTTSSAVGTTEQIIDWSAQPWGSSVQFGWGSAPDTLRVTHKGPGKPWLTIQSLAAIPLAAPVSSGYTIARTITPIEQKVAGAWSRGDIYRVHLDLEAQADMTWVVVRDPIPSGAAILGTGLGGDSQMLTQGERRQGWVWPAFEERTPESFRAYYEFVPKGKWTVEYTVRLNNAGHFEMPESRVEAMYAPESFAEIPNTAMEVRQ